MDPDKDKAFIEKLGSRGVYQDCGLARSPQNFQNNISKTAQDDLKLTQNVQAEGRHIFLFLFISIFVWETISPWCTCISDLQYLKYPTIFINHHLVKPGSSPQASFPSPNLGNVLYLTMEMVLYIIGALCALTLFFCLP